MSIIFTHAHVQFLHHPNNKNRGPTVQESRVTIAAHHCEKGATFFACSWVSPNDKGQFCRATGRELAAKRLEDSNAREIITVTDGSYHKFWETIFARLPDAKVVPSRWQIVEVSHKPIEALPSMEQLINALENELVNEYDEGELAKTNIPGLEDTPF